MPKKMRAAVVKRFGEPLTERGHSECGRALPDYFSDNEGGTKDELLWR